MGALRKFARWMNGRWDRCGIRIPLSRSQIRANEILAHGQYPIKTTCPATQFGFDPCDPRKGGGAVPLHFTGVA